MLPPDVEVRRADSADLEAFYGRDVRPSVKAWIALWRGEPSCIAGIAFEEAGFVAFCDVRPGLKASPIKIWRTAKYILDEMLGKGLPLITQLNTSIDKSEKFLQSLGFEIVQAEDGHVLYRVN